MFANKSILIAFFSSVIVSSSAQAVIGPIKITLNPTELSSNYFNEMDTFAPFSSEVYTQDDIKNSKATNIMIFYHKIPRYLLPHHLEIDFQKKYRPEDMGLQLGLII